MCKRQRHNAAQGSAAARSLILAGLELGPPHFCRLHLRKVTAERALPLRPSTRDTRTATVNNGGFQGQGHYQDHEWVDDMWWHRVG